MSCQPGQRLEEQMQHEFLLLKSFTVVDITLLTLFISYLVVNDDFERRILYRFCPAVNNESAFRASMALPAVQEFQQVFKLRWLWLFTRCAASVFRAGLMVKGDRRASTSHMITAYQQLLPHQLCDGSCSFATASQVAHLHRSTTEPKYYLVDIVILILRCPSTLCFVLSFQTMSNLMQGTSAGTKLLSHILLCSELLLLPFTCKLSQELPLQ